MSKINKIVYLHEHHFSERYFKAFGFRDLINRGFEVEIWNFMPFLSSEEFKNDLPPDTLEWENHIYFENCSGAVKAILQLTPDTIILLGIHYTTKTLPVYRALSRKGLTCLSFLAMALPLGTMPLREGSKKKLERLSLCGIKNKLFHSIPYNLLGVKPVDIVIAMGEKYFRHGYPWSEKSEVLWAHSLDFDEYLTEKIKPGETEPDTCVFLDEYVPLHPDNTAAKFSRVPMKKYYDQMRSFFDYIEGNFKLNVIIAAHPRSHYENLPDIYGRRPVIRGKTAELVKTAGYVIVHQSMSLNFAVLFEKPLIFVVTDDYIRHLAEDPHPQWLADYFGKKLHNIDHGMDIDITEESHVKLEAYRSYRNDYIKKEGSPELAFSRIMADRIVAMS